MKNRYGGDDGYRSARKTRKLSWQWEDKTLAAPNWTMWPRKDASWPRGLHGVRDDMMSRLQRIEASRDQAPDDADQAIEDAKYVLHALEDLLGP
jgi:hypothetical protein